MGLFAHLDIIEAGRVERSISVAGTLTIGRDATNDIVLKRLAVSRHHALLLQDAADLLLVDLESTNGTLVNGVPVLPDEPARLGDGDLIQIGDVLARFRARASDLILVLPQRSEFLHETIEGLRPSKPPAKEATV